MYITESMQSLCALDIHPRWRQFPLEIVNRTKIKTHHYNYTLVGVCHPGWSSLLPQRLYQSLAKPPMVLYCYIVLLLLCVSTVTMQHNTQHSVDMPYAAYRTCRAGVCCVLLLTAWKNYILWLCTVWKHFMMSTHCK